MRQLDAVRELKRKERRAKRLQEIADAAAGEHAEFLRHLPPSRFHTLFVDKDKAPHISRVKRTKVGKIWLVVG